ncbi:hypothetical protein [Evansella cellulosilytica]|uniref:Aldose 1-epimerase n=1 Tax=Evansella cellulosilytica (strain ATCC 21833 / DSM 2522 / FERM P-1141 / JCM 9156 / N-4) TaxID=649639 RepID=E6TWR3_EVAC2|nr:hypothetical protein [Evansella cellulosilytica]ADU28746.1 hypothetical protein Bcell_0464 [Evansella cellulosilytica DSM 2522]
MYYLKNDRLKVEIQEPGTFYKGSRFDWTGFISQITLDGNIEYCVPERLEEGEGTGGLGFCNEFGIDSPIGYDAIEVGELFPKVGVGLLKKDEDAAYDFFRTYEVSPIEVKINKEANSITFETTNASPKGYGYHLIKEVAIVDNRLIIDYRLTNVGKYPIHTNEYSHNFIGINNEFIGEHYQLKMPRMKNIEVEVGSISSSHDQLTWPSTPDGDFYAHIDWEVKNGTYNWDVFHDKIGAGVREISEFEPSKIALWGRNHVVCPEVFIDIKLKPNEVKSWKRVYEFYQDKEV